MKKNSSHKHSSNNPNRIDDTFNAIPNSTLNKEEIFIKMLKAKKVNIADIINLLKTSNLDLNKLDAHGYNLLHYSIKHEQCDIVNSLLTLDDNYQTLKADPDITCCDSINAINLSPLLLALIYCNDTQNSSKIIKFLIRAGADISSKDEEGSTLLLKACEKGRIDILEYLENKSNEENPINWNEHSKNGGPLHMAIIGDQEDTVNYLLEKKLDFNIKDQNQNSALHLALQLKNFNVFKLILDHIKNSNLLTADEKKIIVSAINDEDNTILHELAYAQSSVLTDYVLKNNELFGVDIQKKISIITHILRFKKISLK